MCRVVISGVLTQHDVANGPSNDRLTAWLKSPAGNPSRRHSTSRHDMSSRLIYPFQNRSISCPVLCGRGFFWARLLRQSRGRASLRNLELPNSHCSYLVPPHMLSCQPQCLLNRISHQNTSRGSYSAVHASSVAG
jgi:hypothetical protein